MQSLLQATAHRPWPLPNRPWQIHMEWSNLLFLHFPLPAEHLQPFIPAGLELETFHGFAWLSVVPFQMRNTYPRGTFAVSGLSHFLELNLRTYVTAQGKPGVFFFSLDAESPFAVRAARTLFHLPYFDARMRWEIQGNQTRYLSTRTHRGATPGRFEATYQPIAPLPPVVPGSLDHWLTERYCLYSADPRGHIYRAEVHHLPWPLQAVHVNQTHNSLGALLGLTLPPAEHMHYSAHLKVLGWSPERIS